MAKFYSLAPNPKWIILNNQGEPEPGALLYTKSSLNPNVNKPVYQDIGGTLPYTNPVQFDANGTQGPIYFEVDEDNPDDTYYLEAHTSDNNLLWTIRDFFPPSAGGGSVVTNQVDLKNLIANNVFYDHVDNIIGLTQTSYLIAPSNHVGFTNADLNPYTPPSGRGPVGPDIRFNKSNTSANDNITFETFSLGSNALLPDSTPTTYIKYQALTDPSTETYKFFQFPITQGVLNLDNEIVTFTCWMKSFSGSADVSVSFRQYFGAATGASHDEYLPNIVKTIGETWTKIVVSFTIPDIGGKNLGTHPTGDDAIYVLLNMPLNVACSIGFTKPSLYVGSVSPFVQFETNDQIGAITYSERTGDVKISMRPYAKSANNLFPIPGWMLMDNKTIGSELSAATLKGYRYFNLYKLLWDSVGPGFAPVSGGKGTGDAIEDWNANKTLTVTSALGRFLIGAGQYFVPKNVISFQDNTEPNANTIVVDDASQIYDGMPIYFYGVSISLPADLTSNTTYYAITYDATSFQIAATIEDALSGNEIRFFGSSSGTIQVYNAIGMIGGNSEHTLTIDEMPSHDHTPLTTTSSNGFMNNRIGVGTVLQTSGGSGTAYTTDLTTSETGGDEPFIHVPPYLFTNIYIKL